MKNLFLLPTDKPSRLYYDHNGLFLSKNYQDSKTINSIVKGKNIYITNSEKIKLGDWIYNIVQKTIFKADKSFLKLIGGTLLTNQKIILTTDQDLIKDGVQAIDDEFLEWFVKNPSCEFTEWSFQNIEGTYNEKTETWKYTYKTIVPKKNKKGTMCEAIKEVIDCQLNRINSLKKDMVLSLEKEPKLKDFDERVENKVKQLKDGLNCNKKEEALHTSDNPEKILYKIIINKKNMSSKKNKKKNKYELPTINGIDIMGLLENVNIEKEPSKNTPPNFKLNIYSEDSIEKQLKKQKIEFDPSVIKKYDKIIKSITSLTNELIISKKKSEKIIYKIHKRVVDHIYFIYEMI
jgi:hypothetical protein